MSISVLGYDMISSVMIRICDGIRSSGRQIVGVSSAAVDGIFNAQRFDANADAFLYVPKGYIFAVPEERCFCIYTIGVMTVVITTLNVYVDNCGELEIIPIGTDRSRVVPYTAVVPSNYLPPVLRTMARMWVKYNVAAQDRIDDLALVRTLMGNLRSHSCYLHAIAEPDRSLVTDELKAVPVVRGDRLAQVIEKHSLDVVPVNVSVRHYGGSSMVHVTPGGFSDIRDYCTSDAFIGVDVGDLLSKLDYVKAEKDDVKDGPFRFRIGDSTRIFLAKDISGFRDVIQDYSGDVSRIYVFSASEVSRMMQVLKALKLDAEVNLAKDEELLSAIRKAITAVRNANAVDTVTATKSREYLLRVRMNLDGKSEKDYCVHCVEIVSECVCNQHCAALFRMHQDESDFFCPFY
jgi:hypothetical protein